MREGDLVETDLGISLVLIAPFFGDFTYNYRCVLENKWIQSSLYSLSN